VDYLLVFVACSVVLGLGAATLGVVVARRA